MSFRFYSTICVALLFIIPIASSQTFEGSITYETVLENPHPQIMSDSIWREKMTSFENDLKPQMTHYFYKEGQYKSHSCHQDKNVFHCYNPADGLIYIWDDEDQKALTIDSEEMPSEEPKITKLDSTQWINGIKCSGIRMQTKEAIFTFW